MVVAVAVGLGERRVLAGAWEATGSSGERRVDGGSRLLFSGCSLESVGPLGGCVPPSWEHTLGRLARVRWTARRVCAAELGVCSLESVGLLGGCVPPSGEYTLGRLARVRWAARRVCAAELGIYSGQARSRPLDRSGGGGCSALGGRQPDVAQLAMRACAHRGEKKRSLEGGAPAPAPNPSAQVWASGSRVHAVQRTVLTRSSARRKAWLLSPAAPSLALPRGGGGGGGESGRRRRRDGDFRPHVPHPVHHHRRPHIAVAGQDQQGLRDLHLPDDVRRNRAAPPWGGGGGWAAGKPGGCCGGTAVSAELAPPGSCSFRSGRGARCSGPGSVLLP